MFKKFFSIFIILLFTSPSVQCFEKGMTGISINVLRVIYLQSDTQGISLKLHNKSNEVFLIQSRILPVKKKDGGIELDPIERSSMPFIVTAPLSRIEGESQLTLRIRRNDISLPNDRESVFYVSMKAIPSGLSKSVTNKLVMTVVTNIKLFYRPDGLARQAIASLASKVSFNRSGNQLTAVNPSPYWLTFSKINVGDYVVDKDNLRLMVPPFGSQTYTINSSNPDKVEWQLIDEDGWNTPVCEQRL